MAVPGTTGHPHVPPIRTSTGGEQTMGTTPDTNLLSVQAEEIQIGDTLLAVSGEAQTSPRVVLLKEDAAFLGPDFLRISLNSSSVSTFLLKDTRVMVRRPVTDAGRKAVIDRLLLHWRDADFAAEFGGRDYMPTRACKELTNAIAMLDQGEVPTDATYDDYLLDVKERAYAGTDERYFIIPN
jgi:hypothetical protein